MQAQSEVNGGDPIITVNTDPNNTKHEKPIKPTKTDVELLQDQEKDAAFSDINLDEAFELYNIDLNTDGQLVFRANGDQSDEIFVIDDDTDNASLNVVGAGGIRVQGNDTGDTRFFMENGGGTHYLFDDDSNGHAFKLESANEFAINTGGVNERMRIDAEGRAAINTFVRNGTQLFVESTDYAFSIYGNNTKTSAGNYGILGAATGIGTGTRYGVYGSASGGDTNWAGYFTNDTYVSGDLSVGTTSPAGKLHIKQDIGPGMLLENNGAGDDYWDFTIGSNDLQVYYDDDGPGTNARVYIAYVDDTDGTWNNVSDATAKKDITPIQDGILDKILKITPSSYRLKHANSNVQKTLGFIAQEVQEVLPEAVKTREDGLLAMNYNDMAVLGIKAIQEQQVEIENLKAIINNLQSQNDSYQVLLENMNAQIQLIKAEVNK